MKKFLIKITNVTTTTGGGKRKPLRWRQNQNITKYTTDLEYYQKDFASFYYCGRPYFKTTTSKVVILKEISL